MKSTCVFIGIGNPYRGDDGVGAFVADKLYQEDLPNLDVLKHRGEGTDLLDLWGGYQSVMICDAVVSGVAPGTIHRFQLPEDALPAETFRCSTHVFSLVDVIKLAEALDQLPPKILIYGIEGQQFEQGESLSSVVKAAALTIVGEIALG